MYSLKEVQRTRKSGSLFILSQFEQSAVHRVQWGARQRGVIARVGSDLARGVDGKKEGALHLGVCLLS